MLRRPALSSFVLSLVVAGGAAACGSAGGPTGPVGAPPPRVGAVTVDPRSGPIGTLFTLSVSGLTAGEAVAFEITFPGAGKAFPGAALTVPEDGTTTTTYRATTANQPGVYLVRLTGPPGSLAEGRFTITDGPAVTSTLPGDSDSTAKPSTSLRAGTTKAVNRATTTVKSATTTSTSAPGSSTTATTRRTTTTVPAPTTTKSTLATP